MKISSKNASKLLKQFNEERDSLILQENQSKMFLAAVGEDIESVRPEYDYDAVQKQLKDLEEKIVKLKHAINVFNTTTVLKDFDMSIDEMLVYIPQLTQRKNKLDQMRKVLPKQRVENYTSSNIIDYRIINYDLEKIRKDYDKTVEELNRAQSALDEANINLSFEVDL